MPVKSKLAPVEHTRLRRMQKELLELEERFEAKFKEECNPLAPDTEVLFLLTSFIRARKSIDLALEHHEHYRNPPPPKYKGLDEHIFKIFIKDGNETVNGVLFKQLYEGTFK